MTKKHALLSPSRSKIWSNCAASLQYFDTEHKPNIYAQEGTTAHLVAENIVLGREYEQVLHIDDDMIAHGKAYAEMIDDLKHVDAELFVEMHVKMQRVHEEHCFGTSDAIIINPAAKELHVVDYKYGRYKESAFGNTQIKLYALGVYDNIKKYKPNVDIETIHYHIYQPRIRNHSWDNSTADELVEWGETMKIAAEEALSGKGEHTAGNHCKFCPHNPECAALKTHITGIIPKEEDMSDTTALTLEDISFVLRNAELIEGWLKKIREVAIEQVKQGEVIEGFKVVEGRTIRKWSDDAKAFLASKFGDNAYEPKLKSVTKLVKELALDEIEKYVVKPKGVPTLAPTDDKRTAYKF